MAINRTRAQYDELNTIAQRWAQEEHATRQMLTAIKQVMDTLQGGDWVGEGARAFYAEMTSQVLPALNRLAGALGHASAVTGQISQLVKQAEDEAARALNGQGAPGIGTIGSVGAVSDSGTGSGTGSDSGTGSTTGTGQIPAWQQANPLLARDPKTLYQDDYLRGLIGKDYTGANSSQLHDAMNTLWDNRHAPDSPAAQQALQQIADARGKPLSEIQAGWQKYQQVLAQQEQVAAKKGIDPAEGLNWLHPSFMGSTSQLRSGQVVGDAFGMDPVFGALLNPSGGLVGPGNNAIDLDDSAIGYHGAVHDAAGYLYNLHDAGPGYDYLGREGRDTSSPLSGQREGIKYWRETLPGSNWDGFAGEWVMRGVVGAADGYNKVIDTGSKIWDGIKRIF